MSIVFRKIFLVVLLSLGSNVTYAEVDIKLSCQLSFTTLYASDSSREQGIKTVIIDVYQNNSYLSIIPQDDDFASVSTTKFPHTLNIVNLSTENRWDLTTEVIRQNRKSVNRIMIDRNNGQIYYSRDWNEGRIYTQANGMCNKIDPKTKKF